MLSHVLLPCSHAKVPALHHELHPRRLGERQLVARGELGLGTFGQLLNRPVEMAHLGAVHIVLLIAPGAAGARERTVPL